MTRRKLILIFSFLLAVSLMLGHFTSRAEQHETKKSEKKAILLVAFGTTVPEAKATYNRISEQTTKTFPSYEIRWAYTSKKVRTILKKRGEAAQSPAEALAQLGEDGITTAYIQSLHIIPGDEYDDLKVTAAAFSGIPKGTKIVKVGDPLLVSDADMRAVAQSINSHKPQDMDTTTALVLMGHGSRHPSNIYYPAMQYYLSALNSNIFIGTVEGTPTLDEVVAQLKQRHIKRVWLMPFMLVSGDHAINDMSGDEDTSWKSILTKNGFEVSINLTSLGEFEDIRNIWLKHLSEIVNK